MIAKVATALQLPLLCDYLREKTDVTFDPTSVQGFAIMSDDDRFVGGVLVSNVRLSEGKAIDCEISCAAEASIAFRPEVCKAIFRYVFIQLGCVRCTSITKKSNTRTRQFLEALNFQLEGNVRRGYDGERDALIYGLLADDCQFLEGV